MDKRYGDADIRAHLLLMKRKGLADRKKDVIHVMKGIPNALSALDSFLQVIHREAATPNQLGSFAESGIAAYMRLCTEYGRSLATQPGEGSGRQDLRGRHPLGPMPRPNAIRVGPAKRRLGQPRRGPRLTLPLSLPAVRCKARGCCIASLPGFGGGKALHGCRAR